MSHVSLFFRFHYIEYPKHIEIILKWLLLQKPVVMFFFYFCFWLDQGVLSMQVAHNGYTDPNSLKFENITVMGVTAAPGHVTVSDGNTVLSLSDAQIQYDSNKQVIIVLTLQFSIHHQRQNETVLVTYFN